MRVRLALCGMLVAASSVVAVGLGRGRPAEGAQSETSPKKKESGESASKGPPATPMTCPPAIEVGPSGWRGLLNFDRTAAEREFCGRRAKWNFIRLRPTLREIELWWESPIALQVAVGWGSCGSAPRLCAPASPQVLENWSAGAPLWIAIALPESMSTPAQSESSTGSTQGEKNSAVQMQIPLALGWRAATSESSDLLP